MTKTDTDLEVKKDQIRIALSIGIIGLYTYLLNIFKAMIKRSSLDVENTIFEYFIPLYLITFYFSIVLVILLLFVLYIMCITTKYTYRKCDICIINRYVGNIKDLYDTGVKLFLIGLEFTFYVGWLIQSYAFLIHKGLSFQKASWIATWTTLGWILIARRKLVLNFLSTNWRSFLRKIDHKNRGWEK